MHEDMRTRCPADFQFPSVSNSEPYRRLVRELRHGSKESHNKIQQLAKIKRAKGGGGGGGGATAVFIVSSQKNQFTISYSKSGIRPIPQGSILIPLLARQIYEDVKNFAYDF